MANDTLKKQVEATLQSDFDKGKFIYFTKNLLNHINEDKTNIWSKAVVPDSFKPYINHYERIGQYLDPDGKIIDILIVHLTKDKSLQRARTAQRNFIAHYLKTRGQKDGALVAFVAPDSKDWRFSLVKMDYKFTETLTGKAKVEEEFTPARRWSFLVGSNENSHTAQAQLLPILEDEGYITLEQLEKAFNIEKVTKEFFEKYRDLFLRVHEQLVEVVKNNSIIKTDFDAKDIDTIDFAKKLLGQIVFLYFLQKKGWFGVKRDDPWGSGSRSFLRDLFDKKIVPYENFFNDILEPLFYDALSTDRTDKGHWANEFKCRIPFLNGGLFDPINNYDWIKTDILLPNDLFSNEYTSTDKHKDKGTGILDIFDRYNFTVKEDEPLEKEVAVDPEMLGKVFENLLEVKDRKSKGTYYTPREIVHYMCQQSLINYLATELDGKVVKYDLEELIKYGEESAEFDSIHALKTADNPNYKGDYKEPKLPPSIKQHSTEIDQKLADIKVCDPAIGSGAFPVGMMNEIVKARLALNAYLGANAERQAYTFKRDCIQNSLYGVDIDPGAVEIAKLRLWLSLIVDEDDIEQIKPLPNLDYKIMQGNSLLEEFEGIKLFDEDIVKTNTQEIDNEIAELKKQLKAKQEELLDLVQAGKIPVKLDKENKEVLKKIQARITKLEKIKEPVRKTVDWTEEISEPKRKFDELKQLHQEFFETQHKTDKDRLKKKIEALEWDLIETSLIEQGKTEALGKLEQFKRTNTKPYFLWKLQFSEVFESKGGFDVVIANPPYLRIQGLQETQPDLVPIYKRIFKSAKGSFDLYGLFIERGYNLLKSDGNLAYIVPHKFFQATFGTSLREMLNERKAIQQIVRFGAEQVFEDPTTYTCLLFLSYLPMNSFKLYEIIDLTDPIHVFNKIRNDEPDTSYSHALIPAPTTSDWDFHAGAGKQVLDKLHLQKTSLGEVTRKIFQGIATSADNVYVLKALEHKKQSVICYSKSLCKEVEIENGLVQPFLMGKNVHKYEQPIVENVIIIPYIIKDGRSVLMSQSFIRDNYPLGWEYLEDNKSVLSERENGRMRGDDFYAYIYPKNLTEFEAVKIITPDICNGPQMTLDESGNLYHTTTLYSFVFREEVKDDPKYFLGILNSRLLWYFMRVTGTVLRGGYLRFKTEYLKPFPIRCSVSQNPPSANEQTVIVKLVERIIAITKDEDYLQNKEKQAQVHALEREIDQLVYKLYNLTDEEIQLVEGT